MIDGLDLQPGGLWRVVAAPSYGQQDVGHAPGGPADRFAMWVGNVMLDQDRDTPALEAIYVSELRFTKPALFVLSGARRPRGRLHPADASESISVGHATVTHARAGDRLVLGPPQPGLRTYVCVRADVATKLIGRARPPFDQVCTTADADHALRVVAGPEYPWLNAPGDFLGCDWRLTAEMSDLGLRLAVPEGQGRALPKADPPEITSSPIADGTIQLTRTGPLVLLRQRPTLGGYPRLAVVIDVDLDRLAQYTPGAAVRFRMVEPDEALGLYRQRERDLDALRDAW